ncbi:MAG: peroxiredoxin [Sphingomonadaceae bacterium]|nr:peroxiredoxin [Sphingomonadaceae bacterium]
MIETGEMAPDAALQKPDGTTARLSDYRGRPLVLYFYPKDDTTGCTAEAREFSALADDFERAGAQVLGVSRDPPKSHAKFAAKYDLAVPLASDPDGSVTEAFGVWVEKSMYGRKYMGIQRATFLIDSDGRVARVWPTVRVAGHAAEALEAIRSLGRSAG